MIKIIVNGQCVTGEYTKTAADSIDYLRVLFTFSGDWDGLAKTAQFTQNGKTLNALVENGACMLPNEITEGSVLISVFGVEPSGTKRITTMPFELVVRSSGFVPDGEEPIPPTPDLYSQLVGRVEEAVGNIPEKLSQFENDKGFITSAEVPKKLSAFENDKGFITAEVVPTKLSAFENDKGFITAEAVPTRLSELSNDKGFITSADVPTKLSQLNNDEGFVNQQYVDNAVNEVVNGVSSALADVIAYQRFLIGE